MSQEDRKRLESVNQQAFEDSQTLAAAKKEKLKAELELQKAQEREGITLTELREAERDREKLQVCCRVATPVFSAGVVVMMMMLMCACKSAGGL
jgi:hypothetical protein